MCQVASTFFGIMFPDSCLLGYIGTIHGDSDACSHLYPFFVWLFIHIASFMPFIYIEFRITSGQGIITCWEESFPPVLWAIFNTFSTAHLPIS
jgi:hypothetical protein